MLPHPGRLAFLPYTTLFRSEDFVRIEIESALKQNKRVIPVLVGDTHMPRAEELPEPIRPLARRNAVRLSHERFRADAQGLIKRSEEHTSELLGSSYAVLCLK